MKETEILAPCGDYETVIAAINAGADAVYLGGPLFSARAYAKNLSVDEIINAIVYAHINNCKVYLTLNTLIKNSELKDALNLVNDLYINGLDAIIVQDTGLIFLLKKYFPDLDIHISTQMSIMSRLGVRFFNKDNVTRVVPARELSSDEIKALKGEGLEIECFVHGAMCYSYSGKCLFSSIAGGRSGNRGRCAGPCRKPYSVLDLNHKEYLKNAYPISMKDMCSIDQCNLLIDNNVDSFKIEGRMKAPEYSAFVSKVYKKYKDNYLKTGNKTVKDKDLNILKGLYVRSELQTGYLNKHNGRDMISLSSPAYNHVDDTIVSNLKSEYCHVKKYPVELTVNVFAGEQLSGTIKYNDIVLYADGDTVSVALNNPITSELISKQMCKLGNTYFNAISCDVFTDGNSFVSNGMLNELRRKLVNMLYSELALLEKNVNEPADGFNLNVIPKNSSSEIARLIVGVSNYEQYKAAKELSLTKEFVSDLFSDLWDKDNLDEEVSLFIRIPPVVRDNCLDIIENRIKNILKRHHVSGIYAGSIDGIMMAMKFFDKDKIYGDFGLNIFNDYSVLFFREYLNEYTVSVELNEKNLSKFQDKSDRQLVVYGYIPLMYSANCVVNTVKNCDKNCKGMILKDEAKREFYSECNHALCFNTIYNNVPLCLFSEIDKIQNEYSAFRVEFVNESSSEVKNILENYKNRKKIENYTGNGNNNYTLGHYKRGVE